MTYSAWDFAGQDAYHVPHQLFLSSRAIYLVPFNLAAGLGAGSLSEEVFLSLPHIQALRFWLASIAVRLHHFYYFALSVWGADMLRVGAR